MSLIINNKSSSRFFELDALRGLAAMAVVLFHYTYGIDNGKNTFSANKFYFSYGYLGVDLFFLISGFVIFMTLDRTKRPFDFVVSRFSRLYPAYWAAIITTITLTSLLGAGDYSLKQIVVNITMFQYWLKIKDIDGAYWTLAVELTFYLIMWVLFVCKKLNYISFISIVWLFISAVFALFDVPFENYINVVFILKYAPLFIGGIAFYNMKTDEKNITNHILVILSYISICIVFYSIHSDLVVYPIVALFYVIFYLFVYEKLFFLNNKVLLFLGSISYSVYLIHENVGIAIIKHLENIIDNQLFYLPITLSIILIAATIINKAIEKPALKWIRNQYKSHAK
ncbi:acyltransferase family protein [Flavobacterium sp. WC2509]|uniref:acyltransferase family protein n=1 Tax=Flavobacterium sp. WC2509 TaxID=3461406 RepID=UPI0040446F92